MNNVDTILRSPVGLGLGKVVLGFCWRYSPCQRYFPFPVVFVSIEWLADQLLYERIVSTVQKLRQWWNNRFNQFLVDFEFIRQY